MSRGAPRDGDVLLVTRKFPPSVGGMEKLSADLYAGLASAGVRPRLIALRRGNKHLVWWLPYAAFRTAVLLSSGRIRHLVTGDALMFAVLMPVLWIGRPRITVVACGLDLTWPVPIYQKYIRWALRFADFVAPISAATATVVADLGVPVERITLLRPAVSAPLLSSEDRAIARARLVEALGIDPDNVLVLTLGRLVRRKGVDWFVRAVVPHLPRHVSYLVAGTGPDEARLRRTIGALGLSSRVVLLGRVSDDMRDDLLAGADVFVQPNITVPGDIEGFGLVVVEASLRGLPVVAADLEGLQDAVEDGRTGYLCASGDAEAFVNVLTPLCLDRASRVEAGIRFQTHARELHSVVRFERDCVHSLRIGGT